MKTLLTVGEAAKRLGISYQSAYQWVLRGELPTVVVAGRRRVPADALVEIIRRWNEQAISNIRSDIRSER